MRLLTRYILGELVKVFVLALAAFTGLVCLGLVLKELQDKGLGPLSSVAFMGLSVPYASYLALGPAALLATTLIYGRLTTDREVQACRASGIPLAALLRPAAMLAVAAGALHLGLAAWPLPETHHAMKTLLLADAERLFFAQLGANKEVKFKKEGFHLTVDRVVGDVLYGPTLRRRSTEGQLYVYAPLGKVEFDHRANRVSLTLWEAMVMDESGRTPARGTHKGSLDLPTAVLREIDDQPLWALMAARHRPERIDEGIQELIAEGASEGHIRHEMAEVRARAAAEFHGRLAAALGCLATVLLGAVLGILFHSGHLLTAFGLAFVAWAAATFPTIMGMRVVASHVGDPEAWLHLVWTPNVAMVVLTAGAGAYLLGLWARPRRVLRRRRAPAA